MTLFKFTYRFIFFIDSLYCSKLDKNSINFWLFFDIDVYLFLGTRANYYEGFENNLVDF